MMQTSGEFDGLKPGGIYLAFGFPQKKSSAPKKKVAFIVESCSGGTDVANSRELLSDSSGFTAP